MSEQVERIRAKLHALVADDPSGPKADQARRILSKLPTRDVGSMARAESGMAPEPSQVDNDPSGMQSTGVAGALAGLPFDPATQGVTGMHGETADPLARDITTSIAISPAVKLGMGAVGMAGRKFLASPVGQRGITAAQKAGPVASPEAVAAARAEAEAIRSELGANVDKVAARSPAVAEVLQAPAAMEANAAKAAAIDQAKKEMQLRMMPTITPQSTLTGMGADLMRHNVNALASRTAPLVQGAVNATANAGPVAAPTNALLLQWLMTGGAPGQ